MKAILTDVTKCTGCHECVKACGKSNKLGKHIPNPRQLGDGLSANRWTSIIKRPGSRFVRRQCRHCNEPACASACIVGALKKTKYGPVVYDKSKCIGCRYCMMACPYSIPKYEWETAVPYVRKCTFCADRLADGKEPACTDACPEGATIFGTREDLLAEAKKRLKEKPGTYLQRVFGEFEVGGTSVLYISDIPLGFLGWKDDLGKEPLPKLTWNALSKVPAEFLGMGALMGGIYWIIERRRRLGGSNPSEQEEK